MRSTALFSVLLIATILLTGIINAQEMTEKQKKEMEAYMKLGAKNEYHEFLKAFVGNWNVQTTMWMDPSAPPTKSTGTSKIEQVLDGRFLSGRFKGTMMGQPFEGIQTIGYDNLKQKFTSFWIDNTSTAFYFTEGNLDPSGKVLNETGQWPDPVTGGTTGVRAVTTLLNKNEYLYEMFVKGADGKEFKSMEYRATRKKK